MRFDINLASQPYQDMQRFLLRWGLGLLVAVLITGVLAVKAGQALVSWHQVRAQIGSLQQQIADQDRKKAEAQAILNRAENRDVRNRSEFLNGLIARKAFSWTEVFMDLEHLVPPRLKVISIAPKTDEQDQLIVELQVVSTQRDAAIELVRRLEQSPHFRHASITSEALKNAGRNGSPEVQFAIQAQYLPGYARPAGDRDMAAAESAASDEAKAEPVVKATAGPEGTHGRR
jgi:type IV pilus assembly protein PilN